MTRARIPDSPAAPRVVSTLPQGGAGAGGTRPVWAWRAMMAMAVPTLGVLALLLATSLPPVLADAAHPERAMLLAWAVAFVVATVAVLASLVQRRRGRMTAAIALVAVVALPGLVGAGLLALIVLLFILKPG